jgi:hypothetical protein
VSESPADKLLAAPADLDRFAAEPRWLDDALTRRIDLARAAVDGGPARAVLGVMELARRLAERHALRRVEAGTLDDEAVERVGLALMAFEARIAELRDALGLRAEDLDLGLGPEELDRLL